VVDILLGLQSFPTVERLPLVKGAGKLPSYRVLLSTSLYLSQLNGLSQSSLLRSGCWW